GPNKPLIGADTVFSVFPHFGLPSYVIDPIALAAIVILLMVLIDFFLGTGIGVGVRAAGANPAIAAANGINVGRMKLLGTGLANGLTAMAGAFFAQLFGAADVYSGIGIVIIGLASVIVGIAIFPSRTIAKATAACVAGALLYRFAVALALNADILGL